MGTTVSRSWFELSLGTLEGLDRHGFVGEFEISLEDAEVRFDIRPSEGDLAG